MPLVEGWGSGIARPRTALHYSIAPQVRNGKPT